MKNSQHRQAKRISHLIKQHSLWLAQSRDKPKTLSDYSIMRQAHIADRELHGENYLIPVNLEHNQ